MRRTQWHGLFSVAGLLAATACDDPNDPAELADNFVDAYYVEFDHGRALTMAEGPAAARIEHEQALVASVRQTTSVESSKARVYYEKPERRQVRAELAHHTYVLDIHAGPSPYQRRVMVMTGLKSGRWKVISFRELDRVVFDLDTESAGSGAPKQLGVGTTTRALQPSGAR